MKIIRISNLQEDILKRHLIMEAKMDDFSFETLKTLTSFKNRINYCNKYLGRNVGRGSSRLVYQIDDNTVLKLAMNRKGIAQNEEEFNFSHEAFVDITPNVYDDYCDTSNFTFIVSEYVLPAVNKDFQHVFNVDFDTFADIIQTVASWYDRRHYTQVLSDEEITRLTENNLGLQEYVNYVSNFQPPIGDLMRIANYGLVNRDGDDCIVLLDSGLSDEIWDKYYLK